MRWYAWSFKTIVNGIGDPLLAEINTPMLRSLFVSLIDAEWKPTSQNMIFRVLHALFMFCIKEELLTKNPLDAIPEPKAPKLFPFTLDDNQVDALISVTPKRTKAEIRNYAMLLVFLDCGLRLAEIISLSLNDVSLAQRSLKVFGKGAKERIVFMGSRTAKAVKHWIEVRGFKSHYSDRLFVDRSGNPLKPRHVQKIIFLFGRQAKLPMKLSPHKLRHVSATLAVRHGMDTFTLQRLYGWEKIETAMRYVNAAAPQLREAHAKASPVDRLLDN
jgi:site-specific recombinase XerD